MDNNQKRAKRQGNYKPGPGRPKGSKNKRTIALHEAAQKAVASIDGAFDGDAHAFLQSVYRNPEVPLEVRILAASRALRVEKPSLSAVGAKISADERLEADLRANGGAVTVIELIAGSPSR